MEEEDEIYFLYLFPDNEKIFSLYQTCLFFMHPETYQLDSSMLIELIKDSFLDFTNSINSISELHNAYLSEYIVLEEIKEDG